MKSILFTRHVLPLLQEALCADCTQVDVITAKLKGSAGVLQPVIEAMGVGNERAISVARTAVRGMAETTHVLVSNARFSESINKIMERSMLVASAVEELAASAGEVAGYAGVAVEQARESDAQTARGNDAAVTMVADMELLKQAVHSVASDMEKFMAFAEQINSLTSTVRDIARQTNLLALNAAY